MSQPIYCGNFEYDTSLDDVEGIFRKFGKVDHVAMKTGFAFVYMYDERDGELAISALDGLQRGRRTLRVEWAKGQGATKAKEDERKAAAKPTKTLFVCNFDPRVTREEELERHFEDFAPISRIHIKRNFAFLEFESVEASRAALEAKNGSRVGKTAITVQFNVEEDAKDRPTREERPWNLSTRRSFSRGREGRRRILDGTAARRGTDGTAALVAGTRNMLINVHSW
ncbi:hypothetical protein CYMTET_43507 [Cymbomonas tetramitiformis]|uniref:RRM domain-containing protein n=1 Tax=Cymbomonas tetramitiformis TaxID=36881 RepID=A0AAE0EZW9_9CHLO|nr:hypothetical protein CYMTET_43507 [Cymbomonas tetramitiformis]